MSDPNIHFKYIDYGFEWGAAKVERFFSNKGQVTLSVSTSKDQLDIRVTKSGLIRIGLRKQDPTKNYSCASHSRKDMERIPKV